MDTAALGQNSQELPVTDQQQYSPESGGVVEGIQKYRLTILFTVTAVIALAIAAFTVNLLVTQLAEKHLIRISQAKTAQDMQHVQAMMSDPGMMGHETASDAHSSTNSHAEVDNHSHDGTSNEAHHHDTNLVEVSHQPTSLTLEYLTGEDGLPANYPHLVEGMNIVRMTLYDLDGKAIWGTDPDGMSLDSSKAASFQAALGGEAVSTLITGHVVHDHMVDLDEHTKVLETFLPLRDSPDGETIAVAEVHRDVISDVALQVDEAKKTVITATTGVMGGVFLVLLGFIVVADVNIYRSTRWAVLAVEGANRNLEERVRQRTQELESANDQLVRAERLAAIGQLAGGVAHDLRNPLGAIKNSVYYLKRKLGDTELAQANPRVGQFLQIMEGEIDHSNQIITDLMIFTRVNALSLAPTSISRVIEETLASVGPKPGVQVIKQLDDRLPDVIADAEQLQRVFTNMVVNASEAVPEGGTLTITTRKAGDFVEVEFSDTGMGIKSADLDRIFEPLFTTKTKGTGLGLAVCQQVVSRHKGSIDVSSQEGAGTTFTVRLPLSPTDAGSNGKVPEGE